jgi:hypothetical protein
MIWSIIPEEMIFEGADKMEFNWIETEVQGVKMVVEPTSQPGYARVVRLLCPRPESYLKPQFQPGSTVCLIQQ